MELQVKPSTHNKFPLQGILIKGASALYWLQEIQRMGLSLDQVQVFPLPSKELNSVWGCLVTMPKEQKRLDISPHAYCQLAYHLLFLPERADIFPALLPEELGRLFLQKKHIFHPDFGWVELSEHLDWSALVQPSQALPTQAVRPKLAPYIPTAIRGFQVYSAGTQEVLKNMENNLFPDKAELDDQPLTLAEKGKLWLAVAVDLVAVAADWAVLKSYLVCFQVKTPLLPKNSAKVWKNWKKGIKNKSIVC
jgi:hypothetical protein